MPDPLNRFFFKTLTKNWIKLNESTLLSTIPLSFNGWWMVGMNENVFSAGGTRGKPAFCALCPSPISSLSFGNGDMWGGKGIGRFGWDEMGCALLGLWWGKWPCGPSSFIHCLHRRWGRRPSGLARMDECGMVAGRMGQETDWISSPLHLRLPKPHLATVQHAVE